MSLVVIGVILLFAIPIISIAALVMTLSVRDHVRRLERRIAELDTRAPATAISTPAVTTTPEAAPTVAEPPAPQPTSERAPKPVAVAPPVVAAPATSTTLEEKFGMQWVVWIGGLALALGGIFLVRFTIEQGLLGPGVRIFLAAVFSTILIGAGEWARCNEIAAGIAAIPKQHIPSILTAAGTIAAYATVYAAFALYNFISPATAFVLLGLVALATLAAALLHGPALAGLGVAGAFVTPLLVPSQEPSYWALYVYLAIVTAAAFGLARLRLWRWLAITAVTTRPSARTGPVSFVNGRTRLNFSSSVVHASPLPIVEKIARSRRQKAT